MSFKIGFHGAGVGNHNGIGDHWRALIEAGAPVVFKTVDAYDRIREILSLGPLPEGSCLVYRLTTRGQGGEPFDVPTVDGVDYPGGSIGPEGAARDMWSRMLLALPDDFDKENCWLEVLNEVDKNRAEWLGEFALHIGRYALRDGYKVLLFGWSAGEPEYDHWLEMEDFLRLASENPDRIGVSLHEYSYNRTDIYRLSPHLVGRYQLLLDALHEMGLPPVSFAVTEFGWEYRDIPSSVGEAMQDIISVEVDYRNAPGFLGAHIWYLGLGYGSIDSQTQRLIAPLTSLALEEHKANPESEPVEVPYPPNTGPLEFDQGWVGTYLLHPETLNAAEKSFIDRVVDEGFPDFIFSDRRGVGTYGRSHTDLLQLLSTAVYGYGSADSFLVVLNGHRIGNGLDLEWIMQNHPALAPYVIFVTAEGEPTPDRLEYKYWPLVSDNRWITQLFMARPEVYAQFGLPGHDGIDLGGPEGAVVVAPAGGVIRHASPNRWVAGGGLSAYGYHVVIEHDIDGEYTILAHLDPDLEVVPGDRVRAGDIIGRLGNGRETTIYDSAGNRIGGENGTGPHLHVGRLTSTPTPGWSEWAWGWITDPVELHIGLPTAQPQADPTPAEFRYRGRLVDFVAGVDQPASDWFIPTVAGAMAEAGLGVKFHTSGNSSDYFGTFANGVFDPVRILLSPSWSSPDILKLYLDEVRGPVSRFYEKGARDFILFNEPNIENLGTLVSDGVGFGNLCREVMAYLRVDFPGIRIWSPPVSPGGDGRMDGPTFMEGMAESGFLDLCDGICIHAYTIITDDQDAAAADILNQLYEQQEKWAVDKPIMIGETAVVRPAERFYKAGVYDRVYSAASIRPGVAGVYVFTWSWYGGELNGDWRTAWDRGLYDGNRESLFESGEWEYFRNYPGFNQ